MCTFELAQLINAVHLDYPFSNLKENQSYIYVDWSNLKIIYTRCNYICVYICVDGDGWGRLENGVITYMLGRQIIQTWPCLQKSFANVDFVIKRIRRL